MRRTDRRGALWLGCLGLMWPGVAAGRSVVVVPLAAGEGVTPEEAQSVGDVLAAAIRERGHEVLGPADATRALDRDEPGCVASRRPSCWARGARTLGSDVVVSGRVARDRATGDVSITLEAIDVDTVQVVSEASHHAVAPAGELDEVVRAVAERLLDRLPEPRRRARLTVTSAPSGASVTVNRRLVGQTPWTGEVAEGPTILLVELEGRSPQTRSFALQPDEVQEVHVELAARDAPGPATEGRRRPHRLDTLDAVLFGLAGVGVVVGTVGTIASIAPVDECRGGPDCPVQERAGAWWPFAAAAGAGLVAGAIVLVRLALGDRVPPGGTAGLEVGATGLGGRF